MKFPAYDPKRDGNPFTWIVRTAPVVRQQLRALAGSVGTNLPSVQRFRVASARPAE